MLPGIRQAVRLITRDNFGVIYPAAFFPGIYETKTTANTAEGIWGVTVPLAAPVIVFDFSVAGFMDAVILEGEIPLAVAVVAILRVWCILWGVPGK